MKRVAKVDVADLTFVEFRRQGDPTRKIKLAPINFPEGAIVEALHAEVQLESGWRGAIAVDDYGHPYPMPSSTIKQMFEEIPRKDDHEFYANPNPNHADNCVKCGRQEEDHA